MTMPPTQSNETRNGLYVQRVLDLPGLLAKKSHFLFGPRQTGKTSMVRHTQKGARVYDLLDTSVYLALSQDPGRIAQEN
jgi:predicted AAA+ superfamily ATPase